MAHQGDVLGRETIRAMGFQITGEPAADQVLDQNPFAVVIGMMLDQQYGMEHAFRGGWKVLSRFGTLEPAAIAAAEPEAFKQLCSQPPAIHRFPGSMAARLQELAALVESKYDGDVTRLWTEPKTGEELFKRVEELPGFGEQKAKIFMALLAKQLGVRPHGWQDVTGDYGARRATGLSRTSWSRIAAEGARLQEAEKGVQGCCKLGEGRGTPSLSSCPLRGPRDKPKPPG